MRAYTEKGDLQLPVDNKIEVKWTNPLISTQGSQTSVISHPFTQNNLANLDFANRLDRNERFKTSRDAWLQFGPFNTKCQLKIFSSSKEDGILGTYYFANGDLNAVIGNNLMMTDLMWEIRDPFTGTTEEKVTQWLAHLTSVMNKTVNDDFHLFPVVVSVNSQNDANPDISNSKFVWLNGIEASDSGMVLIANYPQVELSQDTGITLTLSDPTIVVQLPNAYTNDVSVVVYWQIGASGGNPQHAGRTSLLFLAGQTSKTITLTVNAGQHIVFAKVVYINPSADAAAIYQPVGYGVTPFLKTSYVLRNLFKELGYNLLENIFDTDPVLQYRVELNNTADAILPGKIDFSQLIPDSLVVDYLDALRIRFGIEFVPDSQKNIRIWSWNEAIDSIPDIDLTPFVAGFDKIEWQAAEPLQLSDSKSIDRAATSQDTFEKFIAKYKSYSDSSYGASSIISGGVIFHAASNSFYSDNKRLGSSAFNIVPLGTQTESISAKDAIVPMICVNIGSAIYCPYINSRRHKNTAVEYGTSILAEEDVLLEIMACFALPAIQHSFSTGMAGYEYILNYYMGSQTCYDGSGNKWSALSNQFWGDEGTFQQCYLKKDALKRNSYHKITVNAKIDFMTLYKLSQSIHTRKLYKNQPVLIESITSSINERISDTVIILRTTREYVNTSEGIATWYWSDFVCELTSAALQSNVISASFSGTVITFSAIQAVASNIVVNFDWTAYYHDANDANLDTSSSGTISVTIPSGQLSTTFDVGIYTKSGEQVTWVSINSVAPTSDAVYSYYGSGSSLINSGFQRTLNICVDILYDNNYHSLNNYDGKQAFSQNGNIYAALSDSDLAALALTNYMQRLTDWILYFNENYLSRFPGLSVVGDGARIYNTLACPL
jgi:hypothetical protein